MSDPDKYPTIAPDAYARYLRSALADSQLGRGLLNRKELRRLDAATVAGDSITKEAPLAGPVTDHGIGSLGLSGINKGVLERWFKEDPKTEWIQCVVHPYVYSLMPQHHHGAKEEQWVPEIVAPVSFTVLVNRNGEMVAHGRPGVAREMLEPAASQNRMTIASIDDIDHFFDLNEFPDYQDTNPERDGVRVPIKEVIRYANRLLSETCSLNLLKPFPSDRPEITYTLLDECLIYRSRNAIQTVRPLLQILDAVQTSPAKQHWLSNWSIYEGAFASQKVPANHRTATLRLGMMVNKFSLAPEQHLCESGGLLLAEGDALAINGPPGTGKTAIVQSMIGSAWVKSALNGTPPPLQIIASTSNQAIINALESLMPESGSKEGLLKQRWIKGWQGNGVYLASRNRQEWAAGQGFPTIESISEFENNCDLLQAEEHYLDCADRFLKAQQISLDEAVTNLQDKAKSHASLLRSAERIRLAFEQVSTRQHLTRLFGLINRLNKVIGTHPKGKQALEQLLLWVKQIDRSVTTGIQGSDQMANAKKAYDAYLVTVPSWKVKLANYVTAFERSIEEEFKRANPAFSGLSVDRIKAAGRTPVERPKIFISGMVRTILRDKRWGAILQWIDAALDVTVRYQLFLLATHIHEGEWIIEMKNTLGRGDGDRRSKEKVLRMWRRRSRLSPALISTLHNLPRVMNYWEPSAQVERPLLGELDILVIDEAGQCAPEIAMPSMLLAKRVITIGDEHQLEPVRMLQEDVDGANAIAAGLKPDDIDDQMALAAMGSAGILSTSGSVLKMVQQRSRFSQASTNNKGLMLTDHRRCRPSIIEFCNNLCYEGKLRVRREPEDITSAEIPEIAAIHVPGVARSVQGSQANRMEAIAIAQWVKENQATLVKQYPGKSLGEILGVITPFTQQARLIQEELTKQLGGLSAKEVLVGTVHSIQGAEKPAIIFSPTYSAHNSSPMFFERTPNMLNVTVSRAQDHLIVIGDLQALSQRNGVVRQFSDHLWKHGTRCDVDLTADAIVREAKQAFQAKEILTLSGTEAHNVFLRECLQSRQVHEMTILSPDLASEVAEAVMPDILDFYRRGGLLTIAVSMKHVARNRERFLNVTRPTIKMLMAQGVRVKMVDELHESGLVINEDRLVVTNGGYWMGALGANENPRSLVMTLNSESQEIQKMDAITSTRSSGNEAA